MKKIGLDVDMSTNIKEGYLIAEFSKSELYQDGELNPNCNIRFYAHYPDYLDRTYLRPGEMLLNVVYTPKEIWEMYLEDREAIDKTVGNIESLQFPTNEYQVLHMAEGINCYRGL